MEALGQPHPMSYQPMTPLPLTKEQEAYNVSIERHTCGRSFTRSAAYSVRLGKTEAFPCISGCPVLFIPSMHADQRFFPGLPSAEAEFAAREEQMRHD